MAIWQTRSPLNCPRGLWMSPEYMVHPQEQKCKRKFIFLISFQKFKTAIWILVNVFDNNVAKKKENQKIKINQKKVTNLVNSEFWRINEREGSFFSTLYGIKPHLIKVGLKHLKSKIWKDENHEIYFLSRIVFLEGLNNMWACHMHYVVGDLLLCNTKSEKMGSHDLWE